MDARVPAHYKVDPAEPEALDCVRIALLDARYVFPGDPLVSDDGLLAT